MKCQHIVESSVLKIGKEWKLMIFEQRVDIDVSDLYLVSVLK